MSTGSMHSPCGSILGLLLVLWQPVLGAESVCPPVVTTPTAAQIQETRRQVQDRGIMWRFAKDNRYGYLYGTIHVGKLDWAIPGSTVSQALQDATSIALELDPTDATVQQALNAPQGTSERPELPEALWNRLRLQATKACIPWEQLQALPPLLIAMRLIALDARWDSLDPSYANEFVLAGFAKNAGKELVMLETVAEQRNIFSRPSPAEQLALIEDALSDLETGKSRETINAIADAWARGDLDQVARYGERCGTGTPHPSVSNVCERNLTIAERIEVLHQRGQRVFVAVGILHMVHENALPKLLRERGFTVERVEFDAR